MNKTYTLCRLNILRDGQSRMEPCCMVKEENSGPYIGREYLLYPEESFKIRNHSPDGFEWGYAGSGPAQLALAILLDYCRENKLSDETAERYHQHFKDLFIAVGQDDDTIYTREIKRFMDSMKDIELFE